MYGQGLRCKQIFHRRHAPLLKYCQHKASRHSNKLKMVSIFSPQLIYETIQSDTKRFCKSIDHLEIACFHSSTMAFKNCHTQYSSLQGLWKCQFRKALLIVMVTIGRGSSQKAAHWVHKSIYGNPNKIPIAFLIPRWNQKPDCSLGRGLTVLRNL